MMKVMKVILAVPPRPHKRHTLVREGGLWDVERTELGTLSNRILRGSSGDETGACTLDPGASVCLLRIKASGRLTEEESRDEPLTS
jgi:hypothetical protein